jgi:ankyrin repeat protein
MFSGCTIRGIIKAFTLTSRTDTGPERAECLSKLLSLSLVSVVPVEEQFAELKTGSDLDTWLKEPLPAAIYIQSDATADGPISRILLRKLQENMLAAASYSFSAQDHRRNSTIPLLCSFMYQILNQDPDKFDRICGLYHTIKEYSIWTRGALQAMFHTLLSAEDLDTIFLVIDGIHNANNDSNIKTMLEDLVQLFGDDRVPTKIKIALFGQDSQILKGLSRTFDRIHLSLGPPVWPKQQVASLKSQAVSQIIEARPYLEKFEHQLARFLGQSQDPSQLSLAVHNLLGKTNKKPISQESFQVKINGVPTSTKDAVSSIYKSLPAWARRALGWVLHARRPLQLNELSTAIGLLPSDGSPVVMFNESDLFLDISGELEIAFGPIMKVRNGQVLLADVQFGQYFAMASEEESQVDRGFESKSGTQEAEQGGILDDAQISLLLLRYLSSQAFITEVRKTLRQEPPGKFTTPLLALAEYAVQFWPSHYREAENQGLDYESILPFLNTPGFVQTCFELNWLFDSTGYQPDFCITNALDLAAQLGLVGFVKKLLKDVKGQSREFALALSSWGGHLEVVKILLDAHLDQSPCDMTAAVKYAAIAGYEDIVQLLLNRRMTGRNDFSWDSEILCRVAEIGYETVVMLCLDNEAPVDALFGKNTPLQLAARNGHAAIVYLLLSRGADKDAKQAGDSLKPILEAVKSGQALAVQHLLSSGASVTVRDEEECTPLHLAAQYGQQEMFNLLLDHCKDHSQKDKTGDAPAPQPSIEQPEANARSITLPELDQPNTEGSLQPLANDAGNVKAANLPSDEVAWVDLVNRDGHTALYIATKCGYNSIAEAILLYRDATMCFSDIDDVFIDAAKAGFMNILERLVDSPVGHKNSWKTLKDSTTGMTALHYAARNGYDAVVTFLVQTLNVEVDLEDKDGNTPLMLAAAASQLGIVNFLLEKKADPMHTNDQTETVLHLLSDKRNTSSSTTDQKIVEIFLEVRLSPNLKDDDGKSALHHAAKTGNLPIAESLIRGGADTMAKDRMFWTPLHRASKYGKDKIVQLLIDHGVNTLEPDDDGWIAMHVAASNQPLSLFLILPSFI